MSLKLLPFIILLFQFLKISAQPGELYGNSPQCIFLKCEQQIIETGVQFYYGQSTVLIPAQQVRGFSITDNLKHNGQKEFISFRLSHGDGDEKNSLLVINLYFKNLPPNINFFLQVKAFDVGGIKNITIPSDRGSLSKMKLIYTGSLKGDAYDITSIVFSNAD
jgi:hypothetical protein